MPLLLAYQGSQTCAALQRRLKTVPTPLVGRTGLASFSRGGSNSLCSKCSVEIRPDSITQPFIENSRTWHLAAKVGMCSGPTSWALESSTESPLSCGLAQELPSGILEALKNFMSEGERTWREPFLFNLLFINLFLNCHGEEIWILKTHTPGADPTFATYVSHPLVTN